MAQLDTKAVTWKSKITVDDTVNFGGDLAATGSSPANWLSGAQSIYRTAALTATDYLELDFTFDAKTSGHGISVGLSPIYKAPGAPSAANMAAAWVWDTDNHFKVYEGNTLRIDIGVITLPMSARIIYNAGVLTWRSNAGADTLRFTSVRTVDQVVNEMMDGLQIVAFFFNTSGKFHATLKGGDASTPEVGLVGAGTGRLGIPSLEPHGMDMSSYNKAIFRQLSAEGFPSGRVRPTEGKIWPRNY
jgi:hypothetical protein